MAFQIRYSNSQEYSIMEDVSYRLWRSYSIKRHDPFLISTYTRTCIPFVPLFQMHMQVTFFYCARLCPTKIVVDRWQALHITPRGIGLANYCMRAIWHGFNPKTLPPMWDVFVGCQLCSETSIRLLRFSPLVTKKQPWVDLTSLLHFLLSHFSVLQDFKSGPYIAFLFCCFNLLSYYEYRYQLSNINS